MVNVMTGRQMSRQWFAFILPSCHLLAHMVSIIHSGRAASSMAMTRVVKHRAPGKQNKCSYLISIALLHWSVYSGAKTKRMNMIEIAQLCVLCFWSAVNCTTG